MKVMVTGGTGFIGSHILSLLKEYEVHTISRKPHQISGVKVHIGDMKNKDFVDSVFLSVKPTHLLHLAWYTEHGLYWSSPENEDWVLASKNLFHAFAKYGGKRTVFVGSCAEYEWSHDIYKESDPLVPVTAYGKAKKETLAFLTEKSRELKISSAWGRLFYLYGPGESPKRLLPSVMKHLIKGETAPCTEGKQVRDFMYVEDAALALSQLLKADFEGPMNIASGKGYSVREFLKTAARMISKDEHLKFGALKIENPEPPQIIADVTLLRDRLRFSSNYSLELGLQKSLSHLLGELKVPEPQ